MNTKSLSCKNDETKDICFPTPTCFLKSHTLELGNYLCSICNAILLIPY